MKNMKTWHGAVHFAFFLRSVIVSRIEASPKEIPLGSRPPIVVLVFK